jgi:hypothetical protein
MGYATDSGHDLDCPRHSDNIIDALDKRTEELESELQGIAKELDFNGGEFFPSLKEMESFPILASMLAILEADDERFS